MVKGRMELWMRLTSFGSIIADTRVAVDAGSEHAGCGRDKAGDLKSNRVGTECA